MACVVIAFMMGRRLAAGTRVPVFSKDALYACYKIPYLLQTATGDLLAFAEARGPTSAAAGTTTGDCMDWDITDIVMRRSTDGGATWGALAVVVPGRFGIHTVAGNMAPVQDSATGRVVLPFNRGNVEMHVTHSDDGGHSWCRPRRLGHVEAQVGRHWTWVGFGPPAGVQLRRSRHAGRLVVPMYASWAPVYDNGVLLSSAMAMLSDDGGRTWRTSPAVPNGFLGPLRGRAGNEGQIVELPGGGLLLNARTLYGARMQARSEDGGESWGALTRAPSLPMPLMGCEGSIAAESDRVLLYSGPAGSSAAVARTRMTVFESEDEGASWRERAVLHDRGGVGYSALARLDDGRMAVVYETSETSETVFVPGVIFFDVVPHGRVPGERTEERPYSPAPPALAPALSNASAAPLVCDESWRDDDGDAFVFVHSTAWYLIAVSNVVSSVVAVAIFQLSGMCCCSSSRRLNPALPVYVALKLEQSENPSADSRASAKSRASANSLASESVRERLDAPEPGNERDTSTCLRLCVARFATATARTLGLANLVVWLAGVVASLAFGFDDGERWKRQSAYCAMGLMASIVTSRLFFFVVVSSPPSPSSHPTFAF